MIYAASLFGKFSDWPSLRGRAKPGGEEEKLGNLNLTVQSHLRFVMKNSEFQESIGCHTMLGILACLEKNTFNAHYAHNTLFCFQFYASFFWHHNFEKRVRPPSGY